MRMTSSNPVLRSASHYSIVSDQPVTYANVAIKTVFLLGITLLSGIGAISYIQYFNWFYLIGAMIIAFIAALVGTRSVRLAPVAGVIYAVAEGGVLGVISLLFESIYPGIVTTAFATTMVVLLIMLLLFSTGVIKVTGSFMSILVVGLIAVIVMQLLYLFIPGLGSQYYTLVVVLSAILSALFLLFDFQLIKTSVDAGTDRHVGWILSLGLLVTILWIYIEMLRLLAIFSRR